MNKIKLCIFDMDGLLLDTERQAWFVGEKIIGKELGIDITEEMSKNFMGIGHQTLIKIMKEEYGTDFPAETFLMKLIKYYENFCKNETINLRPGIMELFEYLKQNNILISLGTSTEKEFAEIALKRTGLFDYFDFVVYGDQVKKGKPEPDIYLKSVEHFGLKPEECVVFEDTSIGAKAAYKGNINLIMVPDLKEPSNEDKEKALAIISSLQEAISIISNINK